MHFCGIIIKPKEVSVPKAREVLGEILVARGESDWYSTDDYRERKINGRVEVSLKEFKKVFVEWLKDVKPIPKDERFACNPVWAFCLVGEHELCDEVLVPQEFFEFYEMPERIQLINTYVRTYKKYTMALINKLLKSETEYTVVLLDYHN